MENRRLVGRRYEDFLRNDIEIELSPEEHLIRIIILDPRYNFLVERRKTVRRHSDIIREESISIFHSTANFSLFDEIDIPSLLSDGEFPVND